MKKFGWKNALSFQKKQSMGADSLVVTSCASWFCSSLKISFSHFRAHSHFQYLLKLAYIPPNKLTE